jgi:hypothetical protein
MKRTLVLNLGLAALLLSAAASSARAATEEINFQGTLANAVEGGTSVSGQFGFDFTTDTVTSYKFTAPGDSFDSSVFNDAIVNPFTSSGTSYLNIEFANRFESFLTLVVNSTIAEFFTQSFFVGTALFHSGYLCNTSSCESSPIPPVSDFASGAVTSSIPEPSTWAMMALGFGLLGFAGYGRAGMRTPSALA